MKLLSPRVHGYIDVAIAALLVSAPMLLRFGTAAAVVSYVTAAVHLAMSLLTDYPIGASRKIPFPVHGAVEFSLAACMLASPWLLGFSKENAARIFFVSAGIALLLVVMLTRYSAGVLTRRMTYDRYDR